MTTQKQNPHVVVGVDGSSDNLGAVRYAVAEAAAREAVLRLVHVVPDYLPVSPMFPLTPDELMETGTIILQESATLARASDPTVRVEGRLCCGTRSVRLAEAAEHAALLVVGRDARPLSHRLLRGDLATGVAARAKVPVVVVPATWEPERRGVVLVGVKAPKHAAELLAVAFATASRAGAKLVVVHAWKLPSAYDDIIEARVDTESWRREATLEVEALLRDGRTAYPDVEVEVRIVHDHAGHALVEASRAADLLVIVRREHGVPAALHLGSTARTVLHAAHCPVEVVVPTHERPTPALVTEEHGELVR
ncbi:universal stress protein [Nocardioides sp. MAH-18]|uniref:Universal stress protein n=1 Tax=Nocardioides agri TaxID=2682843 RepID=A0A6L6XMY3_9ACTN|nr:MULTISPECIES: universal stress protein [unclassified Nocardioides]MBA2953238.1 universal stress protein [Nocardioides sp. CGMCC 1.13656]MVQ48107.1 universal stress protein [Nocardioides sp. MAH-18]